MENEMGRNGRKLLKRREDRDEPMERLDLFKDGRALVEAAQGFIVDAEEMITGRKAGRKRLEAASTALAALVDIPIVPEFVEVMIARVIIQTVFLAGDGITALVRKVTARRQGPTEPRI